MKKKLLFVVDEREMGGVSIALKDLVTILDKNLYEIDILCLHDKGEMLENLEEDITLFFGTSYFEAIDYTFKEVLRKKDLTLILKKIQIIFDIKTGLVSKRIINERKKIIKKKYDIEIAYKDGFTALFTACGDTPKKIHWLHCAYKTNDPTRKYRNLFKRIFNKFNHIVGVSPDVIKEFNEIYHMNEITEFIPLIINSDRIVDLSKLESKVKVNSNKFNVILLGRCHSVKGYNRLFDILENCRFSNVDFHIFGDGPLYSSLFERTMNNNLNVIKMHGSSYNPYAELKQFDLLMLPSYSESFGLVIIESFLLGVPVLCTKTVGSQMTVDEKYGVICENNEIELEKAMIGLIGNYKKINEFKNNLCSYSYDNQSIIRKIDNLFI